jgi:GNAT superfamily N-acetyltransferase
MIEWNIESLKSQHNRSQFDCGNIILNDWLRLRATQYERRHISRTFVATRVGAHEVLGFYSLSAHHVEYRDLTDKLTKGMPRLDIPVVLIGRLGVDLRVQGQGLGSALVVSAFRRTLKHAKELGIRGVEVDAIDEKARAFYMRLGFESLRDDVNHLFMSMTVLEKLGLPPMD